MDARLSFPVPGRVNELLVQQGQAVKKGDLLMRLDDTVVAAQVEILEAQADDTVRIDAGQANLDMAVLQRDKTELLYNSSKAVGEMELMEARLDVTIKELSLKLARFEHDQDRRKHRQAQAELEQMRLKAPFDGLVEQVLVEVGESIDASTPVIRLVKVDPLWVDVPVPLEQARGLATGQPATVRFDDGAALEGKILHVASVANIGTLTVRVELPNRACRPAGQSVWVQFGRPADAEPVAAVTRDTQKTQDKE